MTAIFKSVNGSLGASVVVAVAVGVGALEVVFAGDALVFTGDALLFTGDALVSTVSFIGDALDKFLRLIEVLEEFTSSSLSVSHQSSSSTVLFLLPTVRVGGVGVALTLAFLLGDSVTDLTVDFVSLLLPLILLGRFRVRLDGVSGVGDCND